MSKSTQLGLLLLFLAALNVGCQRNIFEDDSISETHFGGCWCFLQRCQLRWRMWREKSQEFHQGPVVFLLVPVDCHSESPLWVACKLFLAPRLTFYNCWKPKNGLRDLSKAGVIDPAFMSFTTLSCNLWTNMHIQYDVLVCVYKIGSLRTFCTRRKGLRESIFR